VKKLAIPKNELLIVKKSFE